MTRVSGAACVELNTPRGGLGELDARRGRLENPGKSSARAHLRSSKRSSVRRVSAVSRDRKHADAARVRLRDVTRALGRFGLTRRGRRTPLSWMSNPRVAREHPGGLRAVGGIRGGSPPRISLRGSKRLSTREDVARGAHVGRESGVLCPGRSSKGASKKLHRDKKVLRVVVGKTVCESSGKGNTIELQIDRYRVPHRLDEQFGVLDPFEILDKCKTSARNFRVLSRQLGNGSRKVCGSL